MLEAPSSIILSAALQIVPAESIISSRIMQSLPATSPIIFITSLSPAFGLRLSTIAIEAPNLFAIARALTTPPISGETATKFSMLYFSFMSFAKTGPANRLSVGISKNP